MCRAPTSNWWISSTNSVPESLHDPGARPGLQPDPPHQHLTANIGWCASYQKSPATKTVAAVAANSKPVTTAPKPAPPSPKPVVPSSKPVPAPFERATTDSKRVPVKAK